MIPRIAVTMLLFLVFGALDATAQIGCEPLSISDLNFGTYTGTSVNSTTPGTVNCNNNQRWSVGLNAGLGAGATETIRKMTGPSGATLNYQLFRDSAHTLNWGNTEDVDTLTGTGTGRAQPITVYAQLSPGQLGAPGTYTDTISSATTSFTVTAVILATCTISANALSFGNYSGSLVNSSTTLTVTCTNLTSFDIGLNAGTATGATVTTRKMTGPASATLTYSLFKDSAHTLNWGNTVGSDTLHSTGNGSGLEYTVYGQIPAGRYVTPGTYNDTVVATVTY